jgi:hypothetical protein
LELAPTVEDAEEFAAACGIINNVEGMRFDDTLDVITFIEDQG